jgi:hypothetical protein
MSFESRFDLRCDSCVMTLGPFETKSNGEISAERCGWVKVKGKHRCLGCQKRMEQKQRVYKINQHHAQR